MMVLGWPSFGCITRLGYDYSNVVVTLGLQSIYPGLGYGWRSGGDCKLRLMTAVKGIKKYNEKRAKTEL
jgi:hypothetical protein